MLKFAYKKKHNTINLKIDTYNNNISNKLMQNL